MTHDAPWDGEATCLEDGYLTGVRSLARLIKELATELNEATYYV